MILARRELDELARGLRPRALTDRGLAGALADLADRSPLPVEVDVRSEGLPATVEAAVYFVCTEALTNVVKHAHAKRATVAVEILSDRVARITEDGVGGTRLDGAGSGLEGLAERAGALEGTLVVAEAPAAARLSKSPSPSSGSARSDTKSLAPRPVPLAGPSPTAPYRIRIGYEGGGAR